jgi:hypothetical protein
LGDVYPLDESLPLSGEESNLLEPEHPQEAEETHLSNVRRVVITSMCHASSFSMC